MKMVRTSVMVVVVALNCSYTLRDYCDCNARRPIIVCPSIGPTVDLEERERLGLFLGIDDFEAAEFYVLPEGGYEVWIKTRQSKLIATNRDSLGIKIIRDYIKRCEEIETSREAFEKEWKIVDYDDLGQPITQHEISCVNQRHSCCFVGLGTTFVVSLLGGIIGVLRSPSLDQEYYENIFQGASIGGAVGAVIGGLLGNKLDRSSAAKAIKRARKPRVVRRF